MRDDSVGEKECLFDRLAVDVRAVGRLLLNRQRENVTTAFDRARQQFQAGPGEEQDA